MKSVLDFAAAKAAGRKISMVTCYDSSLARVLEATAVDCILVGDSAAMVDARPRRTRSPPPSSSWRCTRPPCAAARRRAS